MFCLRLLSNVSFLDNVLGSLLVNEAGLLPGDACAGNTVGVGVTTLELSLEYLAKVGSADGDLDGLAAVRHPRVGVEGVVSAKEAEGIF